MSVIFYRIDDRLIHGQVMTGWLKIHKAQKAFIVDDEIAKNDFMCDVLRMAAPKDLQVSIFTVEDAIAAIRESGDDEQAIVLAKTPGIMKQLLDSGAVMKELNVGGMGYLPGRKSVLRSIQVSPAELEQLREIAAQGVRVFCQIVPDGKCLELDKVKL